MLPSPLTTSIAQGIVCELFRALSLHLYGPKILVQKNVLGKAKFFWSCWTFSTWLYRSEVSLMDFLKWFLASPLCFFYSHISHLDQQISENNARCYFDASWLASCINLMLHLILAFGLSFNVAEDFSGVWDTTDSRIGAYFFSVHLWLLTLLCKFSWSCLGKLTAEAKHCKGQDKAFRKKHFAWSLCSVSKAEEWRNAPCLSD